MGGNYILDKREYVRNFPSFSVAMCVYRRDNPIWFDKAIHSVIDQTIKPKEIVLVVDGIVPSGIESIIQKYVQDSSGIVFRVVRLKKNQGHGIARRRSVMACSTGIIALMDADDISNNQRFEQQLKKMTDTNSEIVGGDISEFVTDENNIESYRKVPVSDKDIKKYMKKRCPMNQVTVMFKKDVYVRAGGYRDWYCEEDYYLWLRMAEKGAVFANTGTVLVNVRVGTKMYKRRGGLKYFLSEAKLQGYMWKHHFIGFWRCTLNIFLRFIVQILVPNHVRGWIYKKFARRENAE
ncbi:MAG: glycosyltransferase [Lachnospiraceae bacterium]|nr:glycosyltransferase [Lachnospiraceae bacterium]